jgi:hypothetical protein
MLLFERWTRPNPANLRESSLSPVVGELDLHAVLFASTIHPEDIRRSFFR